MDEELKKRLKSTFKFSNNDINKFIASLRKGVFLYEYMKNGKSLLKQHYLKKKNLIVT